MRPFIAALAFAAAIASLPLAHAEAASRFDKADANHDGRVTLQEFEAFAGNRLMAGTGKAAQKFKQLGPDQQASVLQRRFQKLDKARKGYLTREDFDAARSSQRPPKPL
jgi:Ca2+-binding EF-hand superfamily protein